MKIFLFVAGIDETKVSTDNSSWFPRPSLIRQYVSSLSAHGSNFIPRFSKISSEAPMMEMKKSQ
jgi:hypothetical protein